jgi:hypothetical protein
LERLLGSIGSGLKDIGITAGRIVVEPATLLYDVGGYSVGIVNTRYNHQPVSLSGQAYDGVQFGSWDQLRVGAQAQANIWTLGAYGTVEGARNYAATGDPSQWRQAATGQLMATTGARTAVRASQARAQALQQSRADAAAAAVAAEAELTQLARDANPTGGIRNCVNCSVTGATRFEGRSASALAGAGMQDAEVAATYGANFGKTLQRSTWGGIEQEMLGAGDGAHGIIRYSFPGLGGKHTTNLINRGGRIFEVDFQNGGVSRWEVPGPHADQIIPVDWMRLH